jgi:hypothetical protein
MQVRAAGKRTTVPATLANKIIAEEFLPGIELRRCSAGRCVAHIPKASGIQEILHPAQTFALS